MLTMVRSPGLQDVDVKGVNMGPQLRLPFEVGNLSREKSSFILKQIRDELDARMRALEREAQARMCAKKGQGQPP